MQIVCETCQSTAKYVSSCVGVRFIMFLASRISQTLLGSTPETGQKFTPSNIAGRKG